MGGKLSFVLLSFVLLALVGCSRTQLDTQPDPPAVAPSQMRIGLFGDPGVHDESELLQFLSTYGSVVRTQADGAPLTREVLVGFDLVILDQLVRDYSSDEAATFVSWIASGGAVLSLTGYVNASSDWTRPNSLLSPLDATYGSELIMAGPSPESVTWFEPHPLTTGLTAVVFWGGYCISIGGEWTDVAIAQGYNCVVGAARQFGAGRVYMWGDEWIEYTESFTSSPDTKRFWMNAVAWLHP